MIIFLVEKVNVNCNTYKNGWIYLLVIITIICYLNFTEPYEVSYPVIRQVLAAEGMYNSS
jgi:hypothetical protein